MMQLSYRDAFKEWQINVSANKKDYLLSPWQRRLQSMEASRQMVVHLVKESHMFQMALAGVLFIQQLQLYLF